MVMMTLNGGNDDAMLGGDVRIFRADIFAQFSTRYPIRWVSSEINGQLGSTIILY